MFVVGATCSFVCVICTALHHRFVCISVPLRAPPPRLNPPLSPITHHSSLIHHHFHHHPKFAPQTNPSRSPTRFAPSSSSSQNNSNPMHQKSSNLRCDETRLTRVCTDAHIRLVGVYVGYIWRAGLPS
ncbi:hypothetical protein B0J11DRAFT_297634 [Dendryphion nanum]|uniref:Secreted protein n=1 Tax=Dendryphion nanum TaxID=256645 RepID=A0A9P9DXR9_9PLEO|nr:hypothetical protein B0J11DRAFT_297634 [Dendryphion nanum]